MKGKVKGKGKTLGPCFTCGQPGHSYMQCPDRFSKGGGRGKFSSPTSSTGSPSSKGKGKRPFKGKTYFVEYEYVPENVQDINVLSLIENEELDTVAASWVVLDTGATESVARVAAMTRLLRNNDTMGCYITLHERPTFRFGNGLTQRAIEST